VHQECLDKVFYHVNSLILKCKMKNVITMFKCDEVKTSEEQIIKARSLASSTSRVEGLVRAPRWD
jgi:hypothetical protein